MPKGVYMRRPRPLRHIHLADTVRREYDSGLTQEQVAAKLGVGRKTILYVMARCGIPVRKSTVPVPLEKRFWTKAEPEPNSGCWIWTANKAPNGYGVVRAHRERRMLSAHRVAWELTHGSPGALNVLHRCDNRACINPAHLFLGTQSDNISDMYAKGRNQVFDRRGEKSNGAKLTAPNIKAIRSVYRSGGISQSVLAEKYGVIQAHISRIIRGVSWGHVECS